MSQTEGISPEFTDTLKGGDSPWRILNANCFDYTQWRQEGLPKLNLKELAEAANTLASQLSNSDV